MNTFATTASRTPLDTVLRRIARACFAELRRSLEFLGQAHAHGIH